MWYEVLGAEVHDAADNARKKPAVTEHVEFDAGGRGTRDVARCAHVLSLVVDAHVLQVQVSTGVVHDSGARLHQFSLPRPSDRRSRVSGQHVAREIHLSTDDRLDVVTAARHQRLDYNTRRQSAQDTASFRTANTLQARKSGQRHPGRMR